jgi:hypothetical protein
MGQGGELALVGSCRLALRQFIFDQLREELFGDPNYFPEVEEKKAV